MCVCVQIKRWVGGINIPVSLLTRCVCVCVQITRWGGGINTPVSLLTRCVCVCVCMQVERQGGLGWGRDGWGGGRSGVAL